MKELNDIIIVSIDDNDTMHVDITNDLQPASELEIIGAVVKELRKRAEQIKAEQEKS